MESPVKKLDLTGTDKENCPVDEAAVSTLAPPVDTHKPVPVDSKSATKEDKPAVVPGLKPEEADEPLLQENPQRFVLFPIKYHEVRDAFPTRKVAGGCDSR